MPLYRAHTEDEKRKISEGVRLSYARMTEEKRNERNKKISDKCKRKNQLYRFVMNNKEMFLKR